MFHTEAGYSGGFILDALVNYTPVESYYRLIGEIDDLKFDTSVLKKLRRYWSSNDHAILKAR